MSKYLLHLFVMLYVAALFLPGIVFEPTQEDNPKYGLCSAAKNGSSCEMRGPGRYSCGPSGMIPNPTNLEEINTYCGADWDQPRSYIMYGYDVLLFGWLGIFLDTFAWYANICVLVAFVNYKARKTLAFGASCMGILLGLTSFLVSSLPRNEGGVNDFIVAHLGSGYYLWILSLVVLAMYTYLNTKNPLTVVRVPIKLPSVEEVMAEPEKASELLVRQDAQWLKI